MTHFCKLRESLVLTITGALILFQAPAEAQNTRLGGKLWNVNCKGIVTQYVTGADGRVYPGNHNHLFPGTPDRGLAEKAFSAVCGFNPPDDAAQSTNFNQDGCTEEHRRVGYPVWCR